MIGNTCTERGWLAGIIGQNSVSAEAIARVTRFIMLSGGPNNFRDYYGYLNVRLTHCELWQGGTGGYSAVQYLTNCLLHRAYLGLTCHCYPTAPGLALRNCTFRGGIV